MSEVSTVTIWQILTHDLGHQMVTGMVMIHLLPLPLYRPSHSEIIAIHGEGHVCGQKSRSHLKPWVQSVCLLFVSWQSDHFWLRYSKFHIWPWKFKVKVMTEVKPDSHIWGLEFNRCCFSFRGNRTMFGCDIVIPCLTLRIQGQCHGQGQTRWSHLRPRFQSICLIFVPWQLDHFWPRYEQIPYLILKIQSQGHDENRPNIMRLIIGHDQ